MKASQPKRMDYQRWVQLLGEAEEDLRIALECRHKEWVETLKNRVHFLRKIEHKVRSR